MSYCTCMCFFILFHDFRIYLVGTLLTALIRQGDLPNIIQKICAYYIMQDLFHDNNHVVETPFTSVLLHVLETVIVVTKTNMTEKRFITQLLNAGTKDLGKCTPKQIVDQDAPLQQLDMKAVKEHLEHMKELPTTVKESLMNILPAPSMLPSDTAVVDLMNGFAQNDTPLKNSLQPEFFTLAPPLCPVEDELVWFDLTNPAWHKPIYDTSFGSMVSAPANNKRTNKTLENNRSATESPAKVIDCAIHNEVIQATETGKNRAFELILCVYYLNGIN